MAHYASAWVIALVLLFNFVCITEGLGKIASQSIENEARNCATVLDIAFIVDSSGSILPKDYQLQKDFIKTIAQENGLSENGTHIGLVLFSQFASVPIKFNDYYVLEEFKEGVQLLAHKYSVTRIDEGLKAAYDKLFTKGYGARENAHRVAFLLTDGAQTESEGFIDPAIAALTLKAIGVKLLAVGIGSGAKREQLEVITGDPESVFMVKRYSKLTDKKFLEKFTFTCSSEIFEETLQLRLNPTSFPIPTTVPTDPRHDYFIVLKVKNNDYHPIVIKWEVEGLAKEETVENGTQKTIEMKMASKNYPNPITFEAFDEDSGESIALRDRKKLLLIPRQKKFEEVVIIEPHSENAYINFDIKNNLDQNVTLIWQQQGKRKALYVSPNEKKEAEVIFHRKFGLSPITFRGYVESPKKLPVKLNGEKHVIYTPTIKKVTKPLEITKAVKDYFIIFAVENKATDAIEVFWSEDGRKQFLEIPYMGTRSRSIILKDRLEVDRVVFRGFLKGTNQSVLLNHIESLAIQPQTHIRSRKIVADKNYYLDVKIDNQATEDISIWVRQNENHHDFDVKYDTKTNRSFTFDGPKANKPVVINAVSKKTKSKVELNGQWSIKEVPSPEKVELALLATVKHHLPIRFDSKVSSTVVVSWEEQEKRRSIEVAANASEKLELVFKGKFANLPITFSATLKDAVKDIKLNSLDTIELHPTPDNETFIIVNLTESYFLDVAMINFVSGDVKLFCEIESQIKSVNIKRGAVRDLELFSTKPTVVKFHGVMNGTNEFVYLNGARSLKLALYKSRTSLRINITKDFSLQIELKNEIKDKIYLKWKDNKSIKSNEVAAGQTQVIDIATSGQNADSLIQFTASLNDETHLVELNRRPSIEFTPTAKLSKFYVTASAFYIDFVNNCSANVTVTIFGRQSVQEVKIAYNSKKTKYMNASFVPDSFRINAANNNKKSDVLLNGKPDLNFYWSPNTKSITVLLTDDKCQLQVDLGFVVDASGSILPKQYQHQKDFIKKVVELNEISSSGLHAGVVLFSHSSSVAIKLSDFYDSKAFKSAVQKLKHECSITRIDKGLKDSYDKLFTRSYGARSGVAKVLILLTDGRQTRRYSFIEPSVVAKPLLNEGVLLKAIGIGPHANRQELEAITGTSKTVYMIRSFDQLYKEDFLKSFNFNCDPRMVEQLALETQVKKARGPLKEYTIVLDIENKLGKPVVVAWMEGSAEKEAEVRTNRSIDVRMKKEYYPDPIRFSFFEKVTKKPVMVNGRKDLYLIPRTTVIPERVIIAPEKGSSYLVLDIKSTLDEPVVIQWQQNGVKKSITVVAKSTEKKSLEFDLENPGSLSPIEFNGFTKEAKQQVSLNSNEAIFFTPSIDKKVKILLISPRRQVAKIYLNVINNASESAELFWEEDKLHKVMYVDKDSSRSHEIDPKSGKSVPISFGAFSHENGEQNRLAVNGSIVYSLKQALDGKEQTLVIGKLLRFMNLNFINNVAGDIEITKGKAKELTVKRNSSRTLDLLFEGDAGLAPIEFEAKLKGNTVKLNGVGQLKLYPTINTTRKAVFAEMNFYSVLNVSNEVGGPIELQWEVDGVKGAREIGKGLKSIVEIIRNGRKADQPLRFKGILKESDFPVLLNDKTGIEVVPVALRQSVPVLATVHELVLINNASGDVVTRIQSGSDVEIVNTPVGILRSIKIKFNEKNNSLLFSGHNTDLSRKTKYNESLSFKVEQGTSGKRITIVITDDKCQLQVDLGFVVDASGSILPKQYQHQKDFIKKVVELNEISSSGLHAGVVLFSHSSSVAIKLSDFYDSKAFESAVQKLKHECSITRIDKGLKDSYDKLFTRSYGARSGVAKVLILLTDGRQTRRYSFIEPSVVAKPLLNEGVLLKAIGIGPHANRQELEAITGTSKTVYMIRSFDQLYKEDFLKSFNFNCDPKMVEQLALETQVKKARGPLKEYTIVLEIENKLGKPVVVVWMEGSAEKEAEVRTNRSIDVRMKKEYYPDPIRFSFFEKVTKKPVMVNGRKDLYLIPRTTVIPERVIIAPEKGSSYLVLDIKSTLDEPVVIQWQQNGVKKSITVGAKSTEKKSLEFDLEKPGSLSPIEFNGFTKEAKQKVSLNSNEAIFFTPSIDKKVKILLISPRRHVAKIYLNVINNASESAELFWEEDKLHKVMYVDKDSSRSHEIDPKSGKSVPISFGAFSHENGEQNRLAVNGSIVYSLKQALDGKEQTLVIGKLLRFMNLNFINNVAGDIEITKGKAKELTVKRNSSRTLDLLFEGDAGLAPIEFEAKLKGNTVKLNGVGQLKLYPTINTTRKAVFAEMNFYSVLNVSNEVGGAIELQWEVDGVKGAREIGKGLKSIVEIIRNGPKADQPLRFKGILKESDFPVLLNDKTEIEFVPVPSRLPSFLVLSPLKLLLKIVLQAMLLCGFSCPDLEILRIPFGMVKEFKLKPILMVDSLFLTGVNEKTNRKIKFNDRLKLLVNKASTEKSNEIVLTDDSCDLKLDLVFLVDSSGSTTPSQYKEMKDFISSVAISNGVSREGIHAGVVLFSWDASVAIKLNDFYDTASFVSAVREMKHELSSTFLDKGLNYVYKKVLSAGYGARKDARPLLILITPSRQTKSDSYTDLRVASKPLKRAGVHMKAIGIGRRVQRDELEIIVGNTEGVYLVRNFKGLAEKKFLDNFDFRCSIDRILPPYTAVGLDPTKQPERIDIGRLTTYSAKLNVDNLLDEAVLLNWKERGISKQLQIAPNSNKTVEIRMTQDYYPDPISFVAFGKDSKEQVKLLGREKFELILHEKSFEEELVIAPDVGFAYILLDVNNTLDEFVSIQWQENGRKRVMNVPGRSLIKNELAFNLSRPGALGPVSFSGSTIKSGREVSLNTARSVSFTPSTRRTRESLIISEKSADTWIAINVINNAKEDIKLTWYREGVNYFMRVPSGSNRHLEERFYEGQGEHPIAFTAHSYLRGSSFKVMLNSTVSRTILPSSKKITQTLVAGDRLQSLVVNFINEAKGPVVISWLDNIEEKMIVLEKGETIEKHISVIGRDRANPVVFTAKRKDTKGDVRLNGHITAAFLPSDETKKRKIVATDDLRYVVVEFENRAFAEVEIFWQERGLRKSFTLDPKRRKMLELSILGSDALKPVIFMGTLKAYRDEVELNNQESFEVIPLMDKVKNFAVARDIPKYGVFVLKNEANDPVAFIITYNGANTKRKIVGDGSIERFELQLSGESAYMPIEVTARLSDFDFPINVNQAPTVIVMPSKQKTPNKIIATEPFEIDPWYDDYWSTAMDDTDMKYLNLEIQNNATDDIEVVLEKGVKKKYITLKKDQLGKKAFVFRGENNAEPVKVYATTQVIDLVIDVNKVKYLSLEPTIQIKVHKITATSRKPKNGYINTVIENSSHRKITIYWKQGNKTVSVQINPKKIATKTILYPTKQIGKHVTFQSDYKEGILLNKKENVTITVKKDNATNYIKVTLQKVYIIANFVNNAAVPILVNWLENGVKKSKEVAVGETVRQELAFEDGDLKKSVKFTAKRKDNDEVVLLNGASDVSLAVTRDKIAASVVASNYPMYVVADFTNNAAVPIVVNWLENGVKKSKEVAVGETVRQELGFEDGDLKKTVKFTAKRKDNDEVVLLNSASDVSLAVTRDKIAASVVASNYPMFVVADFTNNAAVPIVVNWLENRVTKSKEVAVGETVRQELAFEDGDLKKSVKFTAKRKDNDEVVLLNGASDVSLAVTRDKIAASVVASNYPMYVVADFVNNAAVPIVVNWLENGITKSKDVAVGETVRQELAFGDGDLKKTVKFTAKRKDNDEVVLLNGASDVSLAVTRDKIAASVVASNYPMYVVADFVNNAAVPIVVNWLENGVTKSKEVAVGETVRQELAFEDGDLKKSVKFTAKRKDNDEVVLLNSASDVSLAVTRDKIAASVVASNYPMYVVADFVNNAAVPIVVDWIENGVTKSKEVAVGETVRQELAFGDGDLKKTVKFTAKRKDNDEVVLLNGASDVSLAVTRDKIAASVLASNYPMFVVADFTNNAAVPIVFNWLENGVKKSKEVAVGETVRQELAFEDGDLKKTVKFTAKRKDNEEVVLLNGASDISLAVTRDKIAASVVASNYPMYVVADFVNNAAVPIVVNWLENGITKSKDVAVGETVRQELAFEDGDLKKSVKFTAKRKDNDEVVLLNGASDVSLAVTRDKIAASVVASNYPMYVVADFTNNAAVPIVVNWLENGVKKSKEVAVGETVRQELAFEDGDLKKSVKFTAKRKDNEEVVLLNGASDVSLAVTRDKIAASVVASNYPMYVVADFVNNAAVPIVVNWLENGIRKSKDVAVGETVRQELAFEDGDLKKSVKFTAKRKDNDEVVLLNGASDVSLAVTRDKIAASVVASNYPMYVVADFTNNAAVPIVVNWLENGVKKSKEVAVGETVRQELAFEDGDLKKSVKFTAKRKDNDEVVLLNGASDVSLAVTRDKIAASVVASNYPMYVVADFTNNAAVPIVVNWLENGVKKSKEVAVGETVRQELAFGDGDLKKSVKFTAKRKDNEEVVLLNGASDISLAVTRDKIAASVVASNYPMYVVADFVNNAAVPIVVNWLENGITKSKDVAVGETVRQELAFEDGDLKKSVKFTAKRKDNDEVVLLSGASDVSLAVTRDKIAASVVASNYPMYVFADFVNNAAVPIAVNWLENGITKSKDVAVGETVRQELAFEDGDLKKSVKFTAKRKDNDEVVLLNGASDVSLAVTRDKIAASVVASNYPMYVVADFTNNAAVPIVVNWLENGVKKSKEVAVGETVRQELAFEDGDLKKSVKFTAKRKDNDEVVLLNGASDVSLAVTRDKIAASVVASNYPMYVVADFVNNAAVPIVINWLENGVKKSKEVAVGETVRQELAFEDGDLKKSVKFTAKRKDNDEVVLLNGASDVSLAVTRDKIAASVVASNYPMYVVADFVNNAAVPIVVNWLENGVKSRKR
ncbi:LOW QUALITY PROTEIN: uncharacterized protein LOC135696557 [Rhopilema esculentum]|uniref:LOW QUALITY PROTEIN: uncharacterized protein LOC135696557 n=1 Tax=Rhopilema esculentum TaxID=499914 RepID=UPI0031D334EF